MGEFLGPLRITPTGETAPGGNRIYALDQPLGYRWRGQTFTAPQGYRTDLASIPQQYQRAAPEESPAARPGVIHDYLYTSHDASRWVADAVFLEALRDEGMPLVRRLAMWAAVRVFGGSAYEARLGWAPGGRQ